MHISNKIKRLHYDSVTVLNIYNIKVIYLRFFYSI